MGPIAISIIIPVHNTEKYLSKCLDSCLHQSLDSVEVICVNDGSTDNSESVLLEYLERYPAKMRYLTLKENQGPGAARNEAIRLANGDYLCFVDSDDYIDISLCENVYNLALAEEADIVYFDHCYHQDGNVEMRRTVQKFILNSMSISVYSPCFQIVRKDLLVKNNLFFAEGILYEDAAVVPLWRCFAKKEAYVENCYYHYIKRYGSTMNTDRREVWLQLLSAVRFRYEKAITAGVLDQRKPYFDVEVYADILKVIRRIFLEYDGFTQEIVNSLSRELKIWKTYEFDTSLFYAYMRTAEKELVEDAIHCPEKLPEKCSSFKLFQCDIESKGYQGFEPELRKYMCEIRNLFGMNIGIWGIGKRGIPYVRTMMQMNEPVKLFDNEKCGQYIEEGNSKWRINSLEELNWEKGIILITSSQSFEAIYEQIKKRSPYLTIVELSSHMHQFAIKEISKRSKIE